MDEFVSNLDALHHIQQTALEQLTYEKWVEYSRLLPDGMSGNAFNYHLNYLLKHKLIEKSEKGYSLSALGRVVVESISFEDKRFKLRPTVGVMLLLENADGNILLYKSKRQPLLGQTGLLFGKLRIGASNKATAERMILRKNIRLDEVSELTYHAPLNVLYDQDEELVCHRTGQIWKGKYTGDIKEFNKSNRGSSFWSKSKSQFTEEVTLAKQGNLNDATIKLDT